MTHVLRAFVAATALAVPAVLAAAPATEMIFDEGIAAGLPIGASLRYDYDKVVPAQPAAEADPEAEIVTGFDEGYALWTKVDGADEAEAVEITLGRDGREVDLPLMPASGGNPLVIVFLEQVARSVAGLSGGSPFYIRNRMKEALLTEGARATGTVTIDGAEAEVERVTLTPFEGDPNADRMRGFDGMEVTFAYGDGVPGGIYALDATLRNDAGDAVYHEAMTLESAEVPR